MKRTLNSETIECVGKIVRVAGWVNSVRSHGKILFVDLRDASGVLQVVFNPENKVVYELSQKLRAEWVIGIEGKVQIRPPKMINPKVATGKIELQAEKLEVLARAQALPFPIDTKGYEINEEKRLKYRYLDLRRERMRKNLKIRQKVIQFMREFLIKQGFLEVETPILAKSTPEGARDFLVPSRLQAGKFYALPQSPQQYKQLLQVAGIEKYFQIARCLRDEDPRGDRQAEHTQLDLEMSFVEQEDILNLIEKLYTEIVRKIFPQKRIQKIPFPRLSYKTAMEKYGNDKPDLRKDKNDPNELAFCFVVDFPMFEWHPSTSSGQGWWGATHHPFTKPKIKDIKEIKKSPEKVLSWQHDFVLNGFEIAGGSIRITDLDILSAVFEVLGHKITETKKNFKNYFEAFSFGVPPHGGMASGIDRFLAVVLGEPNIREVMAFPKTGDNRDLMMGAPSDVSKEQLQELHIEVKKRKK